MWSYYGSKSKIVHLYPKPRYDKIIEPFAGSARYALKYFDRDVLLVDKYPVIIKIWEWLQQCSEKDILNLPDLKKGDKVNDFEYLTDVEKWFMGFISNHGCSRPSNSAGGFDGINTKRDKKRIARNLFKIRHWKFKVDNYLNLENETATWFIDPPYQFGGEWYIMKNEFIDFEELEKWCKNRKGQSIVCENSKADWMDFYPLKKLHGQKHLTHEVIWTNLESSYKFRQIEMF